jgi:NIMA (never in mitosis gene a)-related kinase
VQKDKYIVLQHLGEGGFGSAYRVLNREDNREYVLKMIRCEGDAQLQQTVVEMVTMRLCSSPFTVRFVEFFQHEMEVYLVMEYCSEGDLGGRLRELRTPPQQDQVLRWFTQLCLGLARIHKMGFLHRDIKPGNIFFGRWDVVKLGDFGLAAIGGRLVNTERVNGGLAGTPGFLSPEMLRGDPYNAKTDVWALGCTLYEMLTCRSAFRDLYLGRHQTGDGPGVAILVGAQLPRRHIAPHFDAALAEVLALCLEANPDARPSVAELLQLPILARALPAVQDELELLERVTALEDRLGYDPNERSFKNIAARYMPTNRLLRVGASAAVHCYETVSDVGTQLLNAVLWLGTGVFAPADLPAAAKTRLATDRQLNDPPTRAAMAATTALWLPLLLAALGLLAGALVSMALRYWRLFIVSALCPPLTTLCVQVAQRQLRRPPPPVAPRLATTATAAAAAAAGGTAAGAPVVVTATNAIDGARARARSAVAFARELLSGASVPSFLSVPAPTLQSRLSEVPLPVAWPTLARFLCFSGAAVWVVELLTTLAPPGQGVLSHLFYGALTLFGAVIGYWVACVARAATAAAAAAAAGSAGAPAAAAGAAALYGACDSDSDSDVAAPGWTDSTAAGLHSPGPSSPVPPRRPAAPPAATIAAPAPAPLAIGQPARARTLPTPMAARRVRGAPAVLRGVAGQRLVHDCALFAAAGVAVAVAAVMGASTATAPAAAAGASAGSPAATAAAAVAASSSSSAAAAAAAAAAIAAAGSESRLPPLAMFLLSLFLVLSYTLTTVRPVRSLARRALSFVRTRARQALLPPAAAAAADAAAAAAAAAAKPAPGSPAPMGAAAAAAAAASAGTAAPAGTAPAAPAAALLAQAPLFAVCDAALAFVEQAWQPLAAGLTAAACFLALPERRWAGLAPPRPLSGPLALPVPAAVVLLLPFLLLVALGTVAREARHEGSGLVSARVVRFIFVPAIVTFFLFLFVQSFLVSLVSSA